MPNLQKYRYKPVIVDDNGTPVPVGKRLYSSGEATLYAHGGDEKLLLKLHHRPNEAQRRKLAALPALAPIDPGLDERHISFAWPVSCLWNATGEAVGCLVPAVRPAVKKAKSLTVLSNPKLRAKRADTVNWHFLHAVAANTAFLVETLHKQDIVIGDIKPDNFLIGERAQVTLIDCDSVQIGSHLCTVGSEGFTAPEWIGKRFDTAPRSVHADQFGLAVLIYQLLTGSHPWTGEWMGPGDSPTRDHLIREGDWPFKAGSRLRPVAGMLSPDSLSPELETLFRRAFIGAHKDPDIRPTASEWHQACCLALAGLTLCEHSKNHHFSASGASCIWCKRVEAGLPDAFPAPKQETSPFFPLVYALERALARGDARMALDLWRNNPKLSTLKDLETLPMMDIGRAIDSLDLLKASLDQEDFQQAVSIVQNTPVLHENRFFYHETVNGKPVKTVIDALLSKYVSAKMPETTLSERGLPNDDAGDSRDQHAANEVGQTLAYKIEEGWHGLRPAHIVLRAGDRASYPALKLINADTKEVICELPSRKYPKELRLSFPHPRSRTVLLFTTKFPEDRCALDIVAPPKRHRTLGSLETGPDSYSTGHRIPPPVTGTAVTSGI